MCLLTTPCAFADPALSRACVLYATGKQQRATPRSAKAPGRIAPLSPPIVPPAPPDLQQAATVKDDVEDRAKEQAAARVSSAQSSGIVLTRAAFRADSDQADRLILQIQREFRAGCKRRRAVQIVAATWAPPSTEEFANVASLVAGVSRVRAKLQYRVVRGAFGQLSRYTLARAEKRRVLHIRR